MNFIFSRIALQLLKPPVAAIAIFNAMFGWKFFIWPLIITNSPHNDPDSHPSHNDPNHLTSYIPCQLSLAEIR